jgi:hypothetical protein
MGTVSETTAASEEAFCLPPLRNGALGTWLNRAVTGGVDSSPSEAYTAQ